jgi:RHS repeat-associated protein
VVADAVKFAPKHAAKAATWEIAGSQLPQTGSYKVYAKWPASSANATDATYTVSYQGGATAVTVNQRVNGGQWNLLGSFPFNAGGTGYKVELSDNPNGKVAADAIYIAGTAAPTDTFTWTPTFPSAGAYQVYARWPASSANTGAAQYTVTRDGGTSTVTLNQKQNGGSWVLLGSYQFTPSSGQKVTLAASSDGTTIADAMLFAGSGAQPANLLYVHADHLGSPQKMTDTSQSMTWDGVFDPFGKESSLTGLASMPMRFPGQYADDETGYSYNYFRDYDPALGHYIESDPIGLYSGINAYTYARQDPLGFADAKGLKPVPPYPWNFPPVPASEIPFTRFGGGEAHFIVGMGFSVVKCKDECGKWRAFHYWKWCFGAAAGFSGGGGIVFGMNGKNCRSETYEGWFGEVGGSLGPVSGGADVGYDNAGPLGLPWHPTGVIEGSGSVGLGIEGKATLCWYSATDGSESGPVLPALGN